MRVEPRYAHSGLMKYARLPLQSQVCFRPESDRHQRIRRRPRARREPRLSDRDLRPSHQERSCGVNPPGWAVSPSGPRRPSSPGSTRQGSPGDGDGFHRSSVQSTLPGRATHHELDAFRAWTVIFCFAGPPFRFSCWSVAVRRLEYRLRQPVAPIKSIAFGHDTNAVHAEPRTDCPAAMEAARWWPESAVLHTIRVRGPARSATRAATHPRSSAPVPSGRRNIPPHPVRSFPPARCRSQEFRTWYRNTSRALRGSADR